MLMQFLVCLLLFFLYPGLRPFLSSFLLKEFKEYPSELFKESPWLFFFLCVSRFPGSRSALVAQTECSCSRLQSRQKANLKPTKKIIKEFDDTQPGPSQRRQTNYGISGFESTPS
ncbi:unnamed protein product [Polarella glacialis]|uniref:Secreted protein n=1 Tax=Polarella glacialis TaxID=89957 RepID=A0A813HUC6_POLGL|nr:unnamed protein product [Polarella glacialis]CAE8653445.1 unnamed protein product [Polarella glacialis]